MVEGIDADDDYGCIVAPTFHEGAANETPGCLAGIVGSDVVGDDVIRDVIEETIAAEQELIANLEVVSEDIDIDVVFGADGAREDVAVGVLFGGFPGDSLGYGVLDPGVVGGEHFELAVSEAIDSRVADLGNVGGALDEGQSA